MRPRVLSLLRACGGASSRSTTPECWAKASCVGIRHTIMPATCQDVVCRGKRGRGFGATKLQRECRAMLFIVDLVIHARWTLSACFRAPRSLLKGTLPASVKGLQACKPYVSRYLAQTTSKLHALLGGYLLHPSQEHTRDLVIQVLPTACAMRWCFCWKGGLW